MTLQATDTGHPVGALSNQLEVPVTVNSIECPPWIVPTSGAPGSAFTIYDPEGRMQAGDVAVFYVEATDPVLGSPAINVVVSADGTQLTGNVNPGAAPQTPHFVTVRPAIDWPARFNDFAFIVTA